MKVQDLIGETLVSLTTNKARSGLTVLGIVVGIASVIVMVSIGNGTQASIESSIQSIGSNLIAVSPGGTTRSGAPRGASGLTKTLTVEDSQAIAKVRNVAAVAPIVQSQATVTARSKNTSVAITGTSASYPSIRSVDLVLGNWFTQTQAVSAATVAVLGPTTSDNLFGKGSNPIGQRIRISGQPFTVIGVTLSKGSSGFANVDDAVYIPWAAHQRYLTGGSSLNAIYVEASVADQISTAKSDIEALLMRRHKIVNPDNADFTVQSQQDLASILGTITGLLTLLLGSIAGISLVVGGIGIMNMMLTTVTERIREIGLRKAVGSTRFDITSQFLAEAVALTVMGGIIGILLGWGISSIITALSPLTTIITSDSVLLAVGVSTTIGIVFGFYPARRAAKLDAIVALRYQ